MKSGNRPRGFTIIEVMIVLAVSGFMVMSALILLNGETGNTEFTTSIDQIQSALQTAISDVSDGFYQTPASLQCTVTGAGASTAYPYLQNGGAVGEGQNIGCTFIGDIIQFEPSSSINSYLTFPMIGLQYINGTPPTVVASLADAKPIAVYADGTYSTYSSYNTTGLQYGISVAYMKYFDSQVSHGGTAISAIGLFSSFNGYTSSGATDILNNGSQGLQLIPIPNSTANMTPGQLAGLVDDKLRDSGADSDTISDAGASTSVKDPDQGVQICFNSGTNNESDLITVGGYNGPGSVASKHYSSKACI